MPVTTRLFSALLMLLLSTFSTAANEELYRGRTIVTGQTEENRLAVLPGVLRQALAKLSGDSRLLEEPAVEEFAPDPAALIADIRYRDLKEGIPIHDEQGSRDRAYEVTVDFRPDALEELLAALGRTPWPSPRPVVAPVIAVDNGRMRFLLAADGALGRDHRDALAAAAQVTAVPIAVPDEARLASAGVTAGAGAAEIAANDRLAAAVEGDVTLAGTLVWKPEELGWRAEWRMRWRGEETAWTVAGVSFDEAFRNALRGAALVLSGNGRP